MSDSPIKVDVDLAKPATVFIEKVAGAIGIVYEPARIKRKAKAEAESQIILAEAQLKTTAIEQRAAARLLHEETRKQENMESIIEKALPQLEATSDPNMVNDDWLTHFFDQSRQTSDREMQDLWARLLAGEVNKPGSYSKRTVNLVAELEKRDAEQFGKLTNYVWTLNGQPNPLIFSTTDDIYTNNGLSFEGIQHLQALGLVSFDGLAGYELSRPGNGEQFPLLYGSHMYIVQVPEGTPTKLPIGKVLFTNQGRELLAVSPSEEVVGLVEYVKKQVESNAGYKLITLPGRPPHTSLSPPSQI